MDLVYSIIEKRVRAMASSRDPILKRWDFYNNDVAREPYFPRLTDETGEEYDRRFKIGVGWCGAIANRLASYFRKGPIEVSFDVAGDKTHALAQEAGAVWASIATQNNVANLMTDVARDAGVAKEAYTKQRIEFFDRETGEPLKTEGGSQRWLGQVRIDRVNNSFVYRVWDRLGVTYVEAWVRTPGGEYRLLGDYTGTIEDAQVKDFEYIEAIRPASWDPITRQLLSPSGRAIFEDGKQAWSQPIPYPRVPIQRFANMVSRPDSEEGISDIEWAIPLAHAINHIISGAVRSVHYHGWPQMYVSGLPEEQDIVRGPESLMILPENFKGEAPQVGVLTWDQNLEGAMGLQKTMSDFMSAITGVPKHTLEGLDGAGSVVSGVALRLLYHNMNEACKLKEAGFKGPEEAMIRSCLGILAHHNNRPGYFDEVTVTVKYQDDRTPRDRSIELDEDLKLLTMRVTTTLELFVKHRGPALGITTLDDALQHYEQVMEYDAQLREIMQKGQPAGDDEAGPGGAGGAEDDNAGEEGDKDDEKPEDGGAGAGVRGENENA